MTEESGFAEDGAELETSAESDQGFDIELETDLDPPAGWPSDTGASWYDTYPPEAVEQNAESSSPEHAQPLCDLDLCANCGGPVFACTGQLQRAGVASAHVYRCTDCDRRIVDELGAPEAGRQCGATRCVGCGKPTSAARCACFCPRLDDEALAAGAPAAWAADLPLLPGPGVPGTIVRDAAGRPIGRIEPAFADPTCSQDLRWAADADLTSDTLEAPERDDTV